MCNKYPGTLVCAVLLFGALSGMAGCGGMSSKSIPTEETTVSDAVDDTVAEYDWEGQNQETEGEFGTEGQNQDTEGDFGTEEQNQETEKGFGTEEQNQETEKDFGTEEQNVGTESEDNADESIRADEAEIVNAAEFGNPKEVLDNTIITSNAEVKKTEEDELQIEFELENVGVCTFAARKGERFVLPDEVFVDSTKIEWTAQTADGEFIFPYMRENEHGDMFMIDWAYHGYCFAIYGKSPQNTDDRDMAGKIALAMIYNLGGAE